MKESIDVLMEDGEVPELKGGKVDEKRVVSSVDLEEIVSSENSFVVRVIDVLIVLVAITVFLLLAGIL
ncbi:conserved hypothetical protein [Ferroglobus placidus DSM 10642]|uniref:Uncharacterized protein n=1 Tax=Ferroglobus placidus (strain DSM 10642 / AEDII12DO) TaxID=589924 RepID=D3S014_FERPA|nr:hypothetical protein [Ferroglobus placidus]ADC66077.1 conserved hypothetical protein [Ferroglobus placidus DSM 10642]